MAAKHFRYYDDWKSEPLTCPSCGWTCTFEEGSVEHYDELMDSSCPVCPSLDAAMLAIVTYPTMDETAANRDKLSEGEKQNYQTRREFLARLDAQQLCDPKQLCDLEGDRLELSWNFVTNENGEHRNVIRWGDKVVWDEPATWEAYDRFEQVATILKAKYGRRLVDLEPTEASLLYLLGDSFSASAKIAQVRLRIRNNKL